MNDSKRAVIRDLRTGVSGLDEVLGGGIPEYAFNIIAGAPGTGKTTLAQQIVFSNATDSRPAIYFTVLGEPPVKMLRYQQQFSFFDVERVGRDVHFINLSREVLDRDLDAVLERIANEVERHDPSVVVVDSFRTVVTALDPSQYDDVSLQHFIQRLALRLTNWETTSFLIGEFGDNEARDPVFTVADGIIWITNEIEQNTSVRKLRATKMRGQAVLPGLHASHQRARRRGVPRRSKAISTVVRSPEPRRLSTGVSELDEMTGGGIPEGDSMLVAGPTGTGKTILAQHFAAEGIRNGERVVIAVFEEHPLTYMARAKLLGFDFAPQVNDGAMDIMYLRQLDLSVDETLQEIRERVETLGASRVIIDSVSGFEAALAPSYREDFRESFHRLIITLSAMGITTFSTVETTDAEDFLRFSPFNVSFLTDDILSLKYHESSGVLQKVMTVVKMRGSAHSRELRVFEITGNGVVVSRNLRKP